MNKTLKTRKGPSSSATKYSVGTKKKGNDGNMWKIVKNKNGTKRWLKMSNVTLKNRTKHVQYVDDIDDIDDVNDVDDSDIIRNKNKKLYKFWLDLADTKHSVFIYMIKVIK
jgi:hypothetical protein